MNSGYSAKDGSRSFFCHEDVNDFLGRGNHAAYVVLLGALTSSRSKERQPRLHKKPAHACGNAHRRIDSIAIGTRRKWPQGPETKWTLMGPIAITILCEPLSDATMPKTIALAAISALAP
jgi:hypothetical protein